MGCGSVPVGTVTGSGYVPPPLEEVTASVSIAVASIVRVLRMGV